MLSETGASKPEKTNKCRECEMVMFGRSDKRFCSTECRNAYHNRRNSDSNNYVRNINNILRKNRRILEYFLREGEIRVNRSVLNAYGFDFNYFTNLKRSVDGKEWYFCYEISYSNDESNRVIINKIDLENRQFRRAVI